ncbi:AAA domain-containing protein [Elsinoe ampelina]|uniref:AAA domain-containing protein n=1 Tax=Elsinoe ampelina TaxID=302913 RepID=A0A6A6G2Z3_9PEZI|nr:AAA domain-containing protein [Elsinoe ampelina]
MASTEGHPDNDKSHAALKYAFGKSDIKPLVLAQIRGAYDYGMSTDSQTNTLAVHTVCNIVRKLLAFNDDGRSVDISKIAVISPYTRQNQLHHAALKEVTDDLALRAFVDRSPDAPTPEIEVSTIDNMQSREYDIVILDVVATDRLGFIPDPKRICVATTRARYGMVVVADDETLLPKARSRLFARSLTKVLDYLREPKNATAVPMPTPSLDVLKKTR